MQRFLLALMAICSMILSHPGVTHAQDHRAVDPTLGPQKIDEPADTSATKSVSTSDPLVIDADKTVNSIDIIGRQLVLRGHVKHDVVAENSTVTIEKGATVGGTVFLTDCKLANLAGGAVKIAIKTLPAVSAETTAPARSHRAGRMAIARARSGRAKEPSWFGAQFALMLLGLLGAALSVVVTPNASRKVADAIAANPKRNLRVGALCGLGLLAVLVIDAILLHTHTVISYLWAPIGIMIFFAPLLLLGFGWLASMWLAGDCVAHKLNRSQSGSQFGRMALGLFAFFMLNVLLGSMSRTLGVIGLCTEFAIALMGLGAAAIIATGSGFGRSA